MNFKIKESKELDAIDERYLFVHYEPLYIKDAQGRRRKVNRHDLEQEPECFLCNLEQEKRIKQVLDVCAKEL